MEGMKLFFKIALLGALVLTPYSLIYLPVLETTDGFYWKTTEASPSLILGGSRALKGLNPAQIESGLDLKKGSLLNLGFTGVNSPYGKTYLKFVKRKIKRTQEDQIFIVSVIPMSIMDIKDSPVKREDEFGIYSLWMVNQNPNYEYAFRNPQSRRSVMEKLYHVKTTDYNRRGHREVVMHHNGWNETRLLRIPRKKVGRSVDNLIKYDMVRSSEREYWFERTVEYLREMGPVYMVRMPISDIMLEKEEALFPGFNKMMQELADKIEGVYYLDCTKQGADYQFIDRHHHLSGKSAQAFTDSLSKVIKTLP